MISGSDDATIKLWSVASGKIICEFKHHTTGVLTAVISWDQKYILSAGSD